MIQKETTYQLAFFILFMAFIIATFTLSLDLHIRDVELAKHHTQCDLWNGCTPIPPPPESIKDIKATYHLG